MTHEEQQRKLVLLSQLEFAFAYSGGRGISLAEQIDALRAELNQSEETTEEEDNG